MPTMPHFANRLYQPRSRAEAQAPLEAVKVACESDPAYRYAVAQIIADCLKPIEEVTEPPAEDAAARIMNQVRSGGRAVA